MMFNLMNEIRENTKDIAKEIEYIPYYRTGFDAFDYMNGMVGLDGELKLGLPGGRIFMAVGNSGTGKSSLLIQMACNIVKTIPNASCAHLDYEKASTRERIFTIGQFETAEEMDEKYLLLQSGLSGESVYDMCTKLHKLKLDNKAAIEIDSGRLNRKGEKIMILPPTILTVDSVALLAPKDIEDADELKGQMGAAAIAKSNTNIFKRIAGKCEEANIMLFLVNHITKKIDINPMMKSRPDLNFLKQDETIPGGKLITYLTNTLLKLIPASKLTEDKGIKIKGFEVTGEMIKSRSNSAGIPFKLIFDQANGFDNIWTNFENLKEAKRITGAGVSFKLDTCPDVKFTQAAFKEKYLTIPTFKEAVDKAVSEIYTQLLASTSLKEYYDANQNMELIDEENNIYQHKETGVKYQLDIENNTFEELA